MLKDFDGHKPDIHPTAVIFDNALLIGRIHCDPRSSIWPGAVLRADVAEIVIGEATNLQDGVLVHTNHGQPALIGRSTTVGHGAILHGCTIGDNCLIGMGAIILDGAVIEDNCIIGAGAVVTERSRITAGCLVLGVPGKIVRPLTKEEIEANARSADEYVKLAQLHRQTSRQIS